MRDPLILRKSFMAGTKNDPRDVETITEALRATGFLPRPAGGVVPSEAEMGDALRSFQDREGLVVDGYAAPRGPTEGELRKAGKRAAELAARPKRTGPIRFEALTADNYRESRGMAKGVVRRTDHRGAIVLMRRAMEDNPAALPAARRRR